MSKIYGEKSKQESLDRMAEAAMKSVSASDPAEIDGQLRQLLGVTGEATLQDILQMIVDEGWEPHLLRQDFDGVPLWACPIRKGIFRTMQRDEETGQIGHDGYPTPTIAALNGLRLARGTG